MKYKIQLLIIMNIISILSLKAKPVDITAKADFVSDYIWRGIYQNSGFSVQPSLGFSYCGLSLSTWGSQSITNNDMAPQEFDVILSYNIEGFTITATDYWWEGMKAPYDHYRDKHHFEGTVSYYFGTKFQKVPLLISWSTMFAGGDQTNIRKRAYSTYIYGCYDIVCPWGVIITPSIGLTPWKGMYDTAHAAITDITLKVYKDLKITQQFSIPLFVQTIVSPEADKCYLIAGFSVGI